MHVCLSAITEAEVLPFVHFNSVQCIAQNRLAEGARRRARECLGKRQQQDSVEARAIQQLQLDLKRRDQPSGSFGPENCGGMRIERHQHRFSVCLPRARDHLANNTPVPAMHTVKVADSDDAWTEVLRHLVEAAIEDHAAASAIKSGSRRPSYARWTPGGRFSSVDP